MIEDFWGDPKEVVAYFMLERQQQVLKIVPDDPKFSARMIARRREHVRMTMNGRVCPRMTPARLSVAHAKLRQTARELREVEPKKIVMAVAGHLWMDPLEIARLWPAVAKELREAPS